MPGPGRFFVVQKHIIDGLKVRVLKPGRLAIRIGADIRRTILRLSALEYPTKGE